MVGARSDLIKEFILTTCSSDKLELLGITDEGDNASLAKSIGDDIESPFLPADGEAV
jgi:hypothetical protein